MTASANAATPAIATGGHNRFRHDMPFGAVPLGIGPDGQEHASFRLWAPSLEAVDLLLDEGRESERRLPMDPREDGWFACETVAAKPGCHYRYALPPGHPSGVAAVPDPASRFQPDDVHGPSCLIDPLAYGWEQPGWVGRPWEETVLYELHIGTFTPEGTFRAAIGKLDHLRRLGVTAVELMPVADFAGGRGWGYDGVLPFAPEAAYGTPNDLKALVDAIHGHGMNAFLDVVYNHFGPEGNYLGCYAKPIFTARHRTPWGEAVNYDGPGSRTVRDLVIHNALYWLEEYRFDGLRLDAVDRIVDDGTPHILVELAETVRAALPGRNIHLVTEDDANRARHLVRSPDARPSIYTAQWNDDWHHAAHTALTGETGGYYADYADDPAERLLTALTTGYIYQGEASAYRDGERRGEPSGHLPPTAFVNFLQNHDQIGNRALGERLSVLAEPQALEVLTALLLLSPQIPLLFMGEEWGSRTPFYYFCDFNGDLAAAVREGRRTEFARFPAFSDPKAREAIPDPNAHGTFAASRLDWADLDREESQDRLALVGLLLRLRHTALVPRLAGMTGGQAEGGKLGARGLRVTWTLGDGARLTVLANLGGDPVERVALQPGDQLGDLLGDLLFATADGLEADIARGRLPGWSGAWFLTDGAG